MQDHKKIRPRIYSRSSRRTSTGMNIWYWFAAAVFWTAVWQASYMENTNIIETKDITMLFPGVRALHNVNIAVKKGEIHVQRIRQSCS